MSRRADAAVPAVASAVLGALTHPAADRQRPPVAQLTARDGRASEAGDAGTDEVAGAACCLSAGLHLCIDELHGDFTTEERDSRDLRGGVGEHRRGRADRRGVRRDRAAREHRAVGGIREARGRAGRIVRCRDVPLCDRALAGNENPDGEGLRRRQVPHRRRGPRRGPEQQDGRAERKHSEMQEASGHRHTIMGLGSGRPP